MSARKAELRQKARQIRAALSAETRARAAAALPACLPALLEFCAQFSAAAAEPRRFALYYPHKDELDSRPLLSALAARGKKLLLPAMTKHGNMAFRPYKAGQALKQGAFGIYEPVAEGCETAANSVPQALLMPLLAYNARGGRLGYGRGCYDKAIAALRRQTPKIPLIGLAFSAQELPFWPPEPHDSALNAVLTEKGLHRFCSA